MLGGLHCPFSATIDFAGRMPHCPPLSPVLVLSAKKGADIADGFHRVSLVYRLDPYAEVPLKLG